MDCKIPVASPVFPRIISSGSGFFFCGITEEEELNPSSKDMNPNSEVAHNIRSSDTLHKFNMHIRELDANSINESRELVASMLL